MQMEDMRRRKTSCVFRYREEERMRSCAEVIRRQIMSDMAFVELIGCIRAEPRQAIVLADREDHKALKRKSSLP